jgi:hypothetical protein
MPRDDKALCVSAGVYLTKREKARSRPRVRSLEMDGSFALPRRPLSLESGGANGSQAVNRKSRTFSLSSEPLRVPEPAVCLSYRNGR